VARRHHFPANRVKSRFRPRFPGYLAKPGLLDRSPTLFPANSGRHILSSNEFYEKPVSTFSHHALDGKGIAGLKTAMTGNILGRSIPGKRGEEARHEQ
jgi:hypothetical protein